MSATIEIQDDTGSPITSANFGAVDGGADSELKFTVKNVGDQTATSVTIALSRLASNDGIDFAQIAEDLGGNPGPYATTDINIGTLIAGASADFWCKVTVPTGTTPSGNPRMVDISSTYSGV